MAVDFGTFSLERRFAVAPEVLWRLLIESEARAAWGAPSDEDVLIVEESDVRPGGRDRHRCGPQDNPMYIVDTVWFRLSSPEVAAFTESVRVEEEYMTVSLVAYDLVADGDGTRLKVDVAVSSFVGPDGIGDHESGWTSALARLERLLPELLAPAG
ncbi:SRPBCC domain-containing protein [Aestuariibius sp. 2305UL40-4]|uniref:SRPBCC domain-containing protein n=1 Tax=Aestuariibius violaceus TaxID=3234132 RepID=UPI00345EDB71